MVAVIPARRGSKGLPLKNLRLLHGVPLIVHSIRAALAARRVHAVVVSTEDDEIAAVAAQHGADVVRRPAALATDTAQNNGVVRHVLEARGLSDRIVVLLQPTSPLRGHADIDGCIELAIASDGPVVSVCECAKHPAWMFTLDGVTMKPTLPELARTTRRQDLPTAYALNGAVYVMSTADLRAGRPLVTPDTSAYIMPPERSIDIDTEIDLLIASAHL